jgi:hypothetical protein
VGLERKSARPYFDADIHEALTHIADIANMDISEFIEIEITQIVRQRVHEARLLSEKTARLGNVGNRRARTVKSRIDRDEAGGAEQGVPGSGGR